MNSLIRQLLAMLLTSVFVLLLGGCGGGGEAEEASEASLDEVNAYYAAHPEFYVRATLADLPPNLVWQNGDDLPELGSPDAQKGGTQEMRILDFPRTIRSVGPDANGSFRPYIHDDIGVGIAHLYPNVEGRFRYFPGVAEAWAEDLDTQTVYVRLDPNARWSDGKPVTTEDFFYLFYFHQSPEIQDPWYNNFYGIGEKYSRITSYDDRTFSITVATRRPDWSTYVLGLSPRPAHFFGALGPDYVEKYNWRFPPTTGAYVLTGAELERIRTNRDSITLTRVTDWWGLGKKHWRYRFNPDRVRFTVIRDTPKAFEAFLKGDLDMFGLGLAEYFYDKLPANHPLVTNGLIHRATFYNDIPRAAFGVWVNRGKPLLDNQDVRVGIQFALNWDRVIQDFFRGDYQRLRTTAQGYGDLSPQDIAPRPFDIDEALAAFARAGFTRRGSDGILVNDAGVRLSFELTVGTDSLSPVLTILREEALKAGLELRLEVIDATASFKKVSEKNHDLYLGGFGGGVEMYPRYWEFWHSKNAFEQPYLPDGTPNPERKPVTQSNNLTATAIPELDRLIDAYDKSESLDEMRQMAHRMEELLYEDAAFIPGTYAPFYRLAYWRWVKWPDYFDARYSSGPGEFWLHWIDPAAKDETREALRTGGSFPAQPNQVFDRWRQR